MCTIFVVDITIQLYLSYVFIKLLFKLRNVFIFLKSEYNTEMNFYRNVI